MKRFIEGEDRNQATLLPECLDDYITPRQIVYRIQTLNIEVKQL